MDRNISKKYSTKNKFTPAEQMDICRLLGWMVRVSEIQDYLKETYGKTIAPGNLKFYEKSDKWIPIIQKFRDDYMKITLDVPLANKKIRLIELQKHYDKHYEKNDFKSAQDVIRDFRAEMEEKRGDVSFHFTQVNHNQFKDMSDSEIAKKKIEALEQLEKVNKMIQKLENKGEIIDASEDSSATEIDGDSRT